MDRTTISKDSTIRTYFNRIMGFGDGIIGIGGIGAAMGGLLGLAVTNNYAETRNDIQNALREVVARRLLERDACRGHYQALWDDINKNAPRSKEGHLVFRHPEGYTCNVAWEPKENGPTLPSPSGP